MAQTDEAMYTLRVPFTGDVKSAEDAVRLYNRAPGAVFERVTPKKRRTIETKQYMKAPVTVKADETLLRLTMDIHVTSSGSVKPLEILQLLAEKFGLAVKPEQALIIRTGLFGKGKRLIDLD